MTKNEKCQCTCEECGDECNPYYKQNKIKQTNELYIVYEDYIGKKDIISIFRNIENAKYYKDNYSRFCYIKSIIIDFLFKKKE